VQRIKNRSGGNLRLAMLPTPATGFLTRVMTQLCKNHDVQLSIQMSSSDEIVDLVASGLCGIGFAMTPVNAANFQVGPIMSVPSFCILPPAVRQTGNFSFES
jgi:DNA-binding transcriptional LysR family regulator